MLKPVLIGFFLGLLLVGYARLTSTDDRSGTQLTGTATENARQGAAFRHVAARKPCRNPLGQTYILI